MNSIVPMEKLAILYDRAVMLANARTFFNTRGLLEVDCPHITQAASVDAHIDLIPITYAHKERRYLHSSPEYEMKRLLASEIGDIYQLSHVFRDGECGHKHNPEFMMAEWYHVGMPFPDLIEETLDFCRLFLENLPSTILTYREAFQKFAGFDYLKMTDEDLKKYIKQNNIESYEKIESEGKDALLNLILGNKIEPLLGEHELCVLAYYPASQSALAKTQWRGDEQVAERFEIYYKGLELCNGYHELTDAKEQRQRFMEANALRLKLGKEELPIDEAFLEALEYGMPDCSGVAVGFDRLMMLRHYAHHISEVIPFAW